MKKLLLVIAIISVFGACKNGSSNLETNKVMLTDTTGRYSNSVSSDTATAAHRITRSSNYEANESRSKSTTSSPKSGNNTASAKNESATTTTTTTKKKGWSNRAKGAVIGGTAGAVGGAIISKKKGKGAIIGGIVGAAGGYIIGNEKDKKTGR